MDDGQWNASKRAPPLRLAALLPARARLRDGRTPCRGQFPPAGGADDQLGASRNGSTSSDQRINRHVQRVGYRLDADRTALKHAEDRVKDLRSCPSSPNASTPSISSTASATEASTGRRLGGDIVADPPHRRLFATRGVPRLRSAICASTRVDLDASFRALRRMISSSSATGVEVQVLTHLEPVPQRRREQSAAGGRSDHRERTQPS